MVSSHVSHETSKLPKVCPVSVAEGQMALLPFFNTQQMTPPLLDNQTSTFQPLNYLFTY